MTAQIEINPTTLAKYKEIIDFIYEATAKPEGYSGAMSAFGTRPYYVAAELVARGVLKKSGTKTRPVYNWYSSAMAPTKNFYESVAKACVKKERDCSARSVAKKKAAEKASPIQPVQETTDVVLEPIDEKPTVDISVIPDDELICELKRMGMNLIPEPTEDEMMERLAALGYKGKLTITRTETIDIENF